MFDETISSILLIGGVFFSTLALIATLPFVDFDIKPITKYSGGNSK